MSLRHLLCGAVVFALLASGCAATVPDPDIPTDSLPAADNPPAVSAPPAMRGVWLSFLDLEELLTDTDPATAARRLDEAMDACKQAGLNTVFFHARSHSDAWYRSAVFPAAAAAVSLLAEDFDPLQYAAEAAHKRGLALHGWVNPYRIGTDPAKAVTAADTVFEKDGVYYYNPANPAVRALVLDGVREILTGYAVDGIHFDDYFYPEGMAAEGETFEEVPPDTDVIGWRQTQVDMLVSAVHGLCRRYNKTFGVSPSSSLEYCTTVSCANVPRWLTADGYVDYICPQLYVGFAHETRPFDRVLAEWLALPRRDGVALYGGLAFYKVGLAEDGYAGSGAAEWAEGSDILARQVQALRQSAADGFILFRYAQLREDTPSLRTERAALTALLAE